MATIDKPSEKMTDLEYAIHLIMTGRNDPEFQAKACDRMDRSRELMPETKIAVELIREGRDEE
jgi:hypothetical protein